MENDISHDCILLNLIFNPKNQIRDPENYYLEMIQLLKGEKTGKNPKIWYH